MSKSAYAVHIDNAQTWLGKLELNIQDLEEVVTPRTQNISSTRDNRRTPVRRALPVCQALLTDSRNNIFDIKSPNYD